MFWNVHSQAKKENAGPSKVQYFEKAILKKSRIISFLRCPSYVTDSDDLH